MTKGPAAEVGRQRFYPGKLVELRGFNPMQPLSHLGDPRTAGDVIMTLIDEQTHHGAEIALLRDLYHRRGIRGKQKAGS